MSLKNVLEYLDKIEAVTNYEKITKENSDLNIIYDDQQKRIQDLESEVDNLKSFRIQIIDEVYTEAGFRKLVEVSVSAWKKRELAKKVKKKWEKEKDRLIKETIQRYFVNYPDNCPENIQVKIDLKVASELNTRSRTRTGDKAKIRNKVPIITQPVRVVSRPNLEGDEKEEKKNKKNP